MLNSGEIEKQIADYRLRFISVRDEEVEWNIQFPMFVDTFARLLKQNERIPSQDEFIEKYFEFNAAELTQVMTSQRLKVGLEARLRRT